MLHRLLSLLLLLLAADAKIIVTGAAGRTGLLVFKKLLAQQAPGEQRPLALVRTEASAKQLMKLTKCTKEEVLVADISDLPGLSKAFADKSVSKAIICSSAVPKIKLLSLLKAALMKVVGKSARPQFYFREKGSPYFVDYLGAKNIIDACKAAKVSQVVLLGSMGGTQPENFLNSIGREERDPLSGNILLWKRRAEKHLISSGIGYTIIHPGGLTDKEGGLCKIVLGVDDQLLKEKSRSIPRSDVAEVCVRALSEPGAKRRAIDIVAREAEEGGVGATKDWKAFFGQPGNCKYE